MGRRGVVQAAGDLRDTDEIISGSLDPLIAESLTEMLTDADQV